MIEILVCVALYISCLRCTENPVLKHFTVLLAVFGAYNELTMLYEYLLPYFEN